MRVTNFGYIFDRRNGGRVIHGTAYTRVYTVIDSRQVMVCLCVLCTASHSKDSDCDCLAFVLLSHGEDNGLIHDSINNNNNNNVKAI